MLNVIVLYGNAYYLLWPKVSNTIKYSELKLIIDILDEYNN